jgi:hypothetical protein
MGSTGSSLLANMAACRISSCVFPGAAESSRTAIRFSVSVPVLSTHSTVAEPSISIAGTRLVSTRFFEIRHAPSAQGPIHRSGTIHQR